MHGRFRAPLSSLLLLTAFAASLQAQDFPWALLQDGTTLQRFDEHRDNAAACSVARSRQAAGDIGVLATLRCRAEVLPAVERETPAPEHWTPTMPAMVIRHALGAHPVRYPPGSPMDGIDRTTRVLVHVQADGGVERVEIHASSGDARMDAAAVDAARNWVYRPAMAGGSPVPGSVAIPVDFAGVAPPRH